MDYDGVIAANMKWSDFEVIDNDSKSKPIAFEQAKEILINQFMKEDSNKDSIEKMKSDISFEYDEKKDVYYPTWVFYGSEKTYLINCLTGEIK